MKLLSNGREISGKRARHLDTQLLCVKDFIRNDEMEVKFCPAERMIVDCNIKPLVGGKFKMFRDVILNLSGIHHSQVGQHECVRQTRLKMKSCDATHTCCTMSHGIICARICPTASP